MNLGLVYSCEIRRDSFARVVRSYLVNRRVVAVMPKAARLMSLWLVAMRAPLEERGTDTACKQWILNRLHCESVS